MLMSRKMWLVTLLVVVSACVYDHVEGKQKSKDDPNFGSVMRLIRDLAVNKGKDQNIINPFRALARIFSIITFPVRFVLRFITTLLSVVVLSLIGCTILPRVDCDFQAAREAIPQIMKDIQEDMYFYLELAQQTSSS